MKQRYSILALLLSLIAVAVSFLVAERIFERLPHIEDEMAYVWQAQVIARGQLTLPSPPGAKAFLVPFVVDHNGLRFGKYPPGWPAMLALGISLGTREWINPLLAGLSVWLTYRLGKRLFSEIVGLLAAGLTLISPFFLMNSASLLSHPFGLVLSLAFTLAWLDAWEIKKPEASTADSQPSTDRLADKIQSRLQRLFHNERPENPWLPTITAALCMGLLAITRPLTAVGLALPFTLHALLLLTRGKKEIWQRLVFFGLLTGLIAGLLFVWQFAVTGDPLKNPYTLWWEYDQIGFGPGHGRTENGHNWMMAKVNLNYSLWSGRHDLFGWGQYSWIFLPFGVLAIFWRRNWKALPGMLVFPALVFVYLFYWIGAALFGPRYYFEGLFSLTLLSAAGAAFLAGWPVTTGESYIHQHGWRKIRPLALTAALAALVWISVLFYIPVRLGGMHGLYGVQRERLIPFQTEQAQALTPALVIVHPKTWTEYATLLELSNPFLDTPFIFIRSYGTKTDRQVIQAFPERTVINYFPDNPFTLVLAP